MGIRAVDKSVHINISGIGYDPKFLASELAKEARASLAEVQSSGQAPKTYTKYINGRKGAQEESVVFPGPIVYQFEWLTEAVRYSLTYARARSPVRSGRYARAWFAMVNGIHVKDPTSIPPGAEVIITNDVPYARKVEVGAMKMSVPPGIIEDMRQAVQRRFGDTVIAKKTFIRLAGGYRLRKKNRRGETELTYPALVITAKI